MSSSSPGLGLAARDRGPELCCSGRRMGSEMSSVIHDEPFTAQPFDPAAPGQAVSTPSRRPGKRSQHGAPYCLEPPPRPPSTQAFLRGQGPRRHRRRRRARARRDGGVPGPVEEIRAGETMVVSMTAAMMYSYPSSSSSSSWSARLSGCTRARACGAQRHAAFQCSPDSNRRHPAKGAGGPRNGEAGPLPWSGMSSSPPVSRPL